MRIKALLSLAALAACAITVSAQVYSANIVGYYNVALKGAGGFTFAANQFNTSGNGLNAVLPSVPLGTTLLSWDSATSTFTTDIFDGTAWLNNDTGEPSATIVNPGTGFFLSNPEADTTTTFVGEVPQGSISVNYVPGFTAAACPNPQALDLNANSFPQVVGLMLLKFDPATSLYTTYINDGTQWLNNDTGEPVLPMAPAVGEGYFIQNGDAATYTWTRVYP